MSKNKKKIAKLNDEQYYTYIMSLRDEPALYNADGEEFVPENITPEQTNQNEDYKD